MVASGSTPAILAEVAGPPIGYSAAARAPRNSVVHVDPSWFLLLQAARSPRNSRVKGANPVGDITPCACSAAQLPRDGPSPRGVKSDSRAKERLIPGVGTDGKQVRRMRQCVVYSPLPQKRAAVVRFDSPTDTPV